MMPERALPSISRAYTLNLWPKSRSAVAAETASVRMPHTVGCVADMPCVSVCEHGGAARGAHAARRTGPASGELFLSFWYGFNVLLHEHEPKQICGPPCLSQPSPNAIPIASASISSSSDPGPSHS
eukprot:4660512-Prymnesium_polylepis.1